MKKRTLVTHYDLEDVAIDIRALTDGYKPYRWEYQKSNRLDENLRKAIIFRDGGKCVECGKGNTSLEVHHIIPKRHDGENTPSNLITLCHDCHEKVTGREKEFENHFLKMIDSTGNKGLSYASHVMIGKTWLRKNLSALGELSLTTGGDTANKRIDWDIEKTHANDAICITGLKPETCNVAHYVIKPMRRKSKARVDEVGGFRHRDWIEFIPSKGANAGKKFLGYVTALYPNTMQLNFTDTCGKEHKRVAISRSWLVWRFSKVYWFETADIY